MIYLQRFFFVTRFKVFKKRDFTLIPLLPMKLVYLYFWNKAY